MIKIVKVTRSMSEEMLHELQIPANFEAVVRSQLARELAHELLNHFSMKEEIDPITNQHTWRFELGVTTKEDATNINKMLDLPIVQALLNPQAGSKPTTTIKGIVVAGEYSEYHRWLLDHKRDAAEYLLIEYEGQLRSMRGDGLPCYLIGSYKEHISDTLSLDRLIISRGFVLRWEQV